jgi:hypothetical protein
MSKRCRLQQAKGRESQIPKSKQKTRQVTTAAAATVTVATGGSTASEGSCGHHPTAGGSSPGERQGQQTLPCVDDFGHSFIFLTVAKIVHRVMVAVEKVVLEEDRRGVEPHWPLRRTSMPTLWLHPLGDEPTPSIPPE